MWTVKQEAIKDMELGNTETLIGKSGTAYIAAYSDSMMTALAYNFS